MKTERGIILQNSFICDAHSGFEMTPSAPIAPLLEADAAKWESYFLLDASQ